ncbi:hypothetical protein SLEP1_g13807 [Rubroshorea leprosula]|uniref:Uncharacterized protein n=1 Tax=Rubroshorea leprosula TaxID=152421 RepID=A0AAV5IN58_9ROSI|nr:hypothetical protein SLEP1_g13807 [Rubroshorea leprosula]
MDPPAASSAPLLGPHPPGPAPPPGPDGGCCSCLLWLLSCFGLCGSCCPDPGPPPP